MGIDVEKYKAVLKKGEGDLPHIKLILKAAEDGLAATGNGALPDLAVQPNPGDYEKQRKAALDNFSEHALKLDLTFGSWNSAVAAGLDTNPSVAAIRDSVQTMKHSAGVIESLDRREAVPEDTGEDAITKERKRLQDEAPVTRGEFNRAVKDILAAIRLVLDSIK